MYLKTIILYFILCLNIYKIQSIDPSSVSEQPLDASEGSTVEGSTAEGSTAEGSTAEGSTPEGSTPEGSTDGTTNEGNSETNQSTENLSETTELAVNETDRAQSDCPKSCNKNSVSKFQSQCITLKFKFSEKAHSATECSNKCRNYSICSSAMFVRPRKITTFDLNTLYYKVINYENWIPIIEPPLSHHLKEGQRNHQLLNNDQQYQERTAQPDNEEDIQKYARVNTSSLKSSETFGFCYIYEDKLPTEQRLKCSQSHLTFNYDDIDCIEDIQCADKRPPKECGRGKCGKNCKEFNTIQISNGCMGKYYFGHLEAESLHSCFEFCLSNNDCKSVDFGNLGTCLLNYVNRNDTQLMLGCDDKNNEIWDYYEFLNDSECLNQKPKPSPNEDVCLNSPDICKNGGNCEAIQLPAPLQEFTYDCHCPCNWCGKHCDKLNMKTYRNGCLNGSALVWSVAESSSDCIDMCLDEIHCKSVSYSATSGTCVLHWADQHSEPIIPSPKCPAYRTDVSEKEWTYFEIICNTTTCHSSIEVIENKELIGCASNPCLNGGECADIFKQGKSIGYHCLCKCGYCGDRCESHNYIQTQNACIWKSHISNNPSDYYRKSVPLNTCLDVCASKFPLCRSVDFSNKGECFLNNKDSDTAVVTEGCNNYLRQRWALYDLSCVCNNRPVIH